MESSSDLHRKRRSRISGPRRLDLSPEAIATLDAWTAQLLRAEDYAEAIEACRVWASSSSRSPDARPWLRMGAALLRIGRPEPAMGAFERAERLEPEGRAATAGRVEALLQLGRAAEARQVLDTLPKSESRQGRRVEALRHLARTHPGVKAPRAVHRGGGALTSGGGGARALKPPAAETGTSERPRRARRVRRAVP